MAKKFGARKGGKYKIVSSAPSVNKTPVGNAVVPIPYPVSQEYDKASAISKNVKFNDGGAFISASHSTKVVGDAQGSIGGVVSGTVGDKSKPIEFSPSVFINGKPVVREGDMHTMQGGNTMGKLMCQESGSTSKITDDGKIEGETLPPDLDLSASSEMPSLSAASSTKPTASLASGGLGSRSGSPVILQTSQLIYTEYQAEFLGKPTLELSHTYLSRDSYKGMFGNHRRTLYEQSFELQDTNTYRLFLSDGRRFDFIQTQDGFSDTGGIGIDVTQIDVSTFVLEYYNGKRETYHKSRLVSIEDTNNNRVNVVYNKDAKIEGTHNSSNIQLLFLYNPKGLVEKAIDSTQRSWSYSYDKDDNLIQCIDPEGGSIEYSYTTLLQTDESFTFLLTQIDDNGITKLSASYDKLGRVTGYEEEGLSYTYTYTTPTMITKSERASGDTTHYGLDKNGLIFAIVHPTGSTEKEEYDTTTKTATITDKGGNVTIKSFDERNRLLRKVDQSNNETLYEYEGINPRPIKVIAPEGTTTYTYDRLYNVTQIEKADGTFSLEYDERGNLLKSIDTAGNETLFTYDTSSNLIGVTDALGALTQFEYDKAGHQSAVIDADGRKSTFTYDSCDRIIQSRDADGKLLDFRYDKSGKLLGITDPSGNSTSYAYDDKGQIIEQRRSDASLKRFEYLSGGLVHKVLREDGSEVTINYDKSSNPISIDYAGDVVHYNYDSLGNLLSAQDSSSSIEYYYDAHANPITETQGEIDVDRRFNCATGKQEALSFLGKSLSYERDEKGKLSALRTPTQTISFTHDTSGLLKERSYPNQHKESFVYDRGYNLTKIQTATLEFEYSHDKSGLIVEKNGKPFLYDQTGRLTQSPNETFEYDDAGNIVEEQNRYNTLNHRLMQNKTYEFTYDARGNLLSKHNKERLETTHYSFDNRNRLTKVVTIDKQGNRVKTFSFSYDALGRRISKTEDGETLRYLYDKANIVAILNESNQLLATLIHDEGVDTPLSITVHEQPKDKESHEALSLDERYLAELKLQRTYYYHRDHQGSIVALTDKDGDIVESFLYDDAYGKIIDHHKIVETYNPYAYTAREYDALDLYYYRARYYDPNTARFLSEDPIEFLSGDFNWYRYVGNDPVNYKDPSGLCPPCAAAIAIEVVAPEATAVTLTWLAEALAGTAIGAAIGLNVPVGKIGVGADTVVRDEAGNISWTADNEGTTKPVATSAEGVDSTTGIQTKGKTKDKSDCGEQKGYKDSQNENYAETPDGTKMDRDHIPAKQYMIEKAEIMAEEMGKKFNDCVKNAIINEAMTIMIPKKMHTMGKSYGKKGSASGDLSKTANEVAKEDIKTYEDLMDKDNPKNKHKNPLTEEEQKKMDDISDDCKDKIKKGLDEMKKIDYDQFLEDKITENQNC